MGSSGTTEMKMTKSKQCKQALKRKPFVDATLGGVSPSVIGNCSSTRVEPLDEVDDEIEAVPWLGAAAGVAPSFVLHMSRAVRSAVRRTQRTLGMRTPTIQQHSRVASLLLLHLRKSSSLRRFP